MEQAGEENLKDQQPMAARQVKLLESSMSHSQHHQVNHQAPQQQKCPLCDSTNTKFWYYNNYSLSQPRYFCKSCTRYWTHGGTLRNVPVGGGCWKNNRRKASSSSSDSETGRTQPLQPPLIPSQNSGISTVSMISPMNSICFGGENLSHSRGVNQVAENLSGTTQFDDGFGGGGALNIPCQKARQAQPQEFQAPNCFLPVQEHLVQPRPFGSRPETFINTTTASSYTTSNVWNNSTGSATGPSNYPNQWHDNLPIMYELLPFYREFEFC
ncbi:unnamed protein product [Fraxinus pennsylvanica]|uniref:Dof zinc finger protein n=1 Tax=Fraxinus pennsylvanica TaxID=56036 RepID=A0AAD2AGF8_9LAMI|nr:unnamed protein product [Fraxinus pennsylvanica]